jgi:hypothetical protein
MYFNNILIYFKDVLKYKIYIKKIINKLYNISL